MTRIRTLSRRLVFQSAILAVAVVLLVLMPEAGRAFQQPRAARLAAPQSGPRRWQQRPQPRAQASATSEVEPSGAAATAAAVERLKSDLLRAGGGGRDGADVSALVRELEAAAEQAGIGQNSSLPSSGGLLAGEWELVACSEDVTRSSPFFWAFRQALPSDQAEPVLAFTDSIPPPLKEVGPAFQYIDWNADAGTGRLVSKVKVATFGGMATSVMTTRAALVAPDGTNGIRVKVETTKPEESTALTVLLGPLGAVVGENAPAFPSGAALESIRQGSSEVVLRNTFCDAGMRVSRYKTSGDTDNIDNYCVWRRREFASFEFL